MRYSTLCPLGRRFLGRRCFFFRLAFEATPIDRGLRVFVLYMCVDGFRRGGEFVGKYNRFL